jgi:AAA ATPase domain
VAEHRELRVPTPQSIQFNSIQYARRNCYFRTTESSFSFTKRSNWQRCSIGRSPGIAPSTPPRMRVHCRRPHRAGRLNLCRTFPTASPSDSAARCASSLAGRLPALRTLTIIAMATDLRAGVSVVLVAPRRIGKSSLVLRALDQLHKHHVLTAYADLQRTPSKVRFASHLAHAIQDGLLGPGEQTLERATEWFGQLRVRPRITFNDNGKPVFEFTGSAPQVDLDATIERLLEVPEEIAARHNTHGVVVFDEFQEVLDLDPRLPALMRSVFQRQTHLAYVFLGSRQRLLRDVFVDRRQPMYRLARPMSLGPIAPDVFAPFLRARFASGASQITAEGVSVLIDATGGHPNDTQELAHFAWARAVSERRPATPATVRAALNDVITAETARLSSSGSLSAPRSGV